MASKIRIPNLPSSTEFVSITAWHAEPGDRVFSGQTIVDIETDKVMLEVPAETDGILHTIYVQKNDRVLPGDVVGLIDDGTSVISPATIERYMPPVRLDERIEISRAGASSGDKNRKGSVFLPISLRLFPTLTSLFGGLESLVTMSFFSGLAARVLIWMGSGLVQFSFSPSQAGWFVGLQVFIVLWGAVAAESWRRGQRLSEDVPFVSFEHVGTLAVLAALFAGGIIWLASQATQISTSPLHGGIAFGGEVVLFLIGSIVGDRYASRGMAPN